MAALAQRRGARVALSGFWGDQLLVDSAYLVDLVRHLRLPTLLRHLKGATEWRLEDLTAGWVYRTLLSDLVRWTVPSALLDPMRRARARDHAERAPAWFADELRRRAALPPSRPATAGWSGASVHARQLAAGVGSVYQVIGIASEALNAGFHGDESWMPMLDRYLVQFVTSIPGEIVTPAGRSRGLLRDAMVGTLPDEIRLRRSKADGSAVLSSALLSQMPSIRTFLGERCSAADAGLIRAADLTPVLDSWAAAVRTSSDFYKGRQLLDLVGLEAWVLSLSEWQ
jgi:hypothetical protein